ncbi:MAG: glycosyltransferase family 39 protein [Anaerolineales bacterium]|nr:glycosyltransferase family 39 protein [Anaerolineales bacterium]
MDEPNHLQYGQNILNGDSNRFDDSKMPVSAWNALPAKIASYLPEGIIKNYLEKKATARLMTTLFSMLVAFMVFHWSRKLYGFIPALISLGLYVFDPNIIAHSQLVTTDIYVTGMILFCCYWLWKFANSRKWQDGLMFAAMLGLAQLTKYTAVSLYPLCAIAQLAYDWPSLRKSYEARAERSRSVALAAGRYVKYAVVVAVVSVVIINMGFLFNRSFTPLNQYAFRSELFKSIDLSVPVPTPYPYLEGLDWITFKERTGVGFGRVYLLGETRQGKGFAGYYMVASLLKVPIASQIILIAALVFYFADKKRRQSFWKDEWFLLWLVLFYTIYFNFLYRAQIGIRYYLIVFPLLYIFAGKLFKGWQKISHTQKGLSFALALYLIVSVLSYYPNYLAYFNEIVWDRKMAYKYLADSNLDWGQDYYALKAHRAEHRNIVKAPEIPHPLPKTRTFFVPVNQLVGVSYDPVTYQWLRENFEPAGMIAPSYLLFTITPEQMQALCDTTDYCK